MSDEPDERIDRLLAARKRLERQLDDPATPPYSIAPLTNQLRLTDKEIERLRKPAKDAEGLPTTPDEATFLDFLRYRHRRRLPSTRRRDGNDWANRYDAILDTWEAAGFELPPAEYRELRGTIPHDEYRARTSAWVERARLELERCLAAPGERKNR